MRAFRKSFSMFAAAVISFVAASCALFGDEESGVEGSASALTASVSGSVAVSGAAPGVFRKSSARTALPSLNGVSYSVVASGGGNIYVAEVDGENLTFSFGDLAVVEGGTEYAITAAGTVSGREVVSGSCTVTLRPGDALVEDITVKPCAVSENGKVNLTIGIDSGVSESIKSCGISGEGYSKNVAVSGGTITWKSESGDVPAGTYTFSFYDANDVLLYEFRESVLFFGALVTDSWFGSSAYITDGKCVITKTLVDKFALSRIYVSSRKSDSRETGTRAEPYKSVARAMNALLDKDTDYTILVDGELTGAQEIPASVTTANASSITIQGRTGSGTDKIDGNNEGTALTIRTAVPVTIKNLKITGGKNERGNGGGIFTAVNSVVTIKNSVVSGNTAKYGGGIYNSASLVLNGASVESNTATTYGGGIYNKDLAEVYVYGGTNIKNNSVTGMSYGGAVYNASSLYLGFDENKTKTEWSGEMSGNTASQGSAIWTAARTSIYFDSGTIKGKTTASPSDWGILLMGTGTFELSGSARVDSSAPVFFCPFGSEDIFPTFKLVDSLCAESPVATFTMKVGYWKRGQTILTAGDGVTITKEIADKFAFTEDGWELVVASDGKTAYMDSPIYVAAAGNDTSGTGSRSNPFATIEKASSVMSDASIDYSVFINGKVTGLQTIPSIVTSEKAKSITIQGVNGVDENGVPKDSLDAEKSGTTLTLNSTVPVTIKNLKITGGKNASGNGGGIYMASGTNVTLGAGALVGDATQTTASATSCGNYASYGGGIYNEGSLTLGSGAIVRHNYASPFGGGIWNEGGSVTIKEGAEISYNCAGTSDARGGGIRSGGSGSSLTMEGGTISHNSVSHWGGGVMIQGSEFTMTGGTISFNKSTGSSVVGAGGGGIWIDDGAFKMSGDSILSGNEANNKGGGIHVEYADATVEILGGTISGNKASVSGGAISNKGVITVSGGTIENNSAANGGGIYNDGNLYLSAGVISKNTASGSGDNGRGGGVYSTGTLFMYGSAVIGDSSKTEVATDSAFSNKAAFGGGIYSKGNMYLGFSSEDTEATLTGGVCYNYANNTGGITQDAGYESASKTFKIASGSVSYNSQRGIYIGKNTFTMTGGTVSGNETLDTVENGEKNGSGIYIGYDTNAVISGGSITANRACLHGGGMYVAQASSNVTIGGGSISSNTAGGNGSGIAVNLGSLKMQGDAKIDSSNDVYLPSGKYITITGELTGDAPVAMITLTPASYGIGTTVLTAGSGVTLADEVGKFALSNDDYFIGDEGKLIEGYTAAKAISFIPGMAVTGIVRVIGEISSEDITNLTTALKTLYTNKPGVRVTLDLSRTTGLTELPSYAFADEDYQKPGCLALEGIVLPSGLTKIGECNFRKCTNLTTITIPAGVREICDTAFVTSGLSGTLFIPASVCKFGYGVFSGTTVTLEYEDTTSIWKKYKYNGTVVTEGEPGFSSTPFSGTCPTRETISASSQGTTYLQKN